MAKGKKDEEFDDVFNTDTPDDVSERNKAAQSGMRIPYFTLKDDETAVVRFLDDEPVTFYQHRVRDNSLKDGKGGYRQLTCMRKNCPLCKKGDRPRYVGAYRLVHLDNQEGKKIIPKEKVFIKGVKTLEVLAKKSRKKPLTSENLEVERTGSGFDTQWLFEWTGDTAKVKDFQEMENQDLTQLFKPQIEVTERLAKTLAGGDSDDDDDDDVPVKKSAKKRAQDDDEDVPF